VSGPAVYELPGGGRAAFTARTEGNLSSVGGADAALGTQMRERLRGQLGLSALARGYQVHGATVRRVESAAQSQEAPSRRTPADGQATALGGVAALVLVADCMPVAIGAEGAVAIVHAGWRGVAAGVLEEGVRAVRELGGTGPILALVGPSAGPCCYEVGEEVHAALGAGARTGRNADLPAAARERLLTAGADEVRVLGPCTICDARWFSHRREGEQAGRQAGVAWLS
jgi:YfiH family protein